MILLTGATGYVGGRLLPALLARGCRVRCLVRRPVALPAELVVGDVLDEAPLAAAMKDVEAAYYLVHSMGEAADFEERDRRAALAFGRAAKTAGVRRIIYLGGLGRGEGLSKHLASRQEVGRLLGESGVPLVEFRASVILGAGSASFELARALVDKLPVMLTPRWVRTPAQPIAIDDVVAYLVEALDVAPGLYEIGGAERLSYGGIMTAYARRRGVRRLMIPVPVLTPRLSSLWLTLVAPRHARVGRKLIDGVRNETTVADDAASRVFAVRPVGVQEAIRRAVDGLPPEPPPRRGAAAILALLVFLAAPLAAVRSVHPGKLAVGTLLGLAAWSVWRRDGLREGRLAWAAFALLLAGLAASPPAPGWVVLPPAFATALLFGARVTAAGVAALAAFAWPFLRA